MASATARSGAQRSATRRAELAREQRRQSGGCLPVPPSPAAARHANVADTPVTAAPCTARARAAAVQQPGPASIAARSPCAPDRAPLKTAAAGRRLFAHPKRGTPGARSGLVFAFPPAAFFPAAFGCLVFFGPFFGIVNYDVGSSRRTTKRRRRFGRRLMMDLYDSERGLFPCNTNITSQKSRSTKLFSVGSLSSRAAQRQPLVCRVTQLGDTVTGHQPPPPGSFVR
jgi:hypothetical protein